MSETQYAIAFFKMRLKELDRVPFPDHNWLKSKIGKEDRQGDLFDNLK